MFVLLLVNRRASLGPASGPRRNWNCLQDLGRSQRLLQRLRCLGREPGVGPEELHRSGPDRHPYLLQPAGRPTHGAAEEEPWAEGTGAEPERDLLRRSAAFILLLLLLRAVAELAVQAAPGAAGEQERLRRCRFHPPRWHRRQQRRLGKQSGGRDGALALAVPRPGDLGQPERRHEGDDQLRPPGHPLFLFGEEVLQGLRKSGSPALLLLLLLVAPPFSQSPASIEPRTLPPSTN